MKRRAELLECGAEWSRAWSRSTSNFKTLTIAQRAFQSTAAGNIVFSDVRAEGVLFIDVLHQLRKDPMVKLRSYSLNAVAHLYLGASKEDVAYSLINTYNETAAGREKLRSYCVPEEHEILTSRGFLDLDAYQAAVAADPTLLVASYNVAAKALVFERPRELIVLERAQRTLVELSNAQEMLHVWSAGSDSHGIVQPWLKGGQSNSVSMLVTKDHDVFAQLGNESTGEKDTFFQRKQEKKTRLVRTSGARRTSPQSPCR